VVLPDFSIFLVYVFLTTFTPGPNNLMSLSNATRYGFKKSLKFNYGVFVGFLIILILSMLFSVTLYRVLPSVKPYMTAAGAIYILWLASKILVSKPHTDNEPHKKSTSFSHGVLLQFLNPKGILYAITITSTFITPYYDNLFVIMGLTVFLAFVCLLSTCSWSLFGSFFQKVFFKHQKKINILMALSLVYCAVSLLI